MNTPPDPATSDAMPDSSCTVHRATRGAGVSDRWDRMARALERVRTEPGLLRNTIAVLALITIAGVVGGIMLSNQRLVTPWSDRLVVTAEFPAAPGISPGNGQEVRIAGVNVGDITAAEVGPDGHARLELSLQPGHHLYRNAALVLRPKSPLNEMYVTINPGGPPAPEVGAGYEFPLSNTERPIQVDELLGHLDDNAQRMLTSLLAESDVALTSAPTDLPASLDATRTVANDLRPVAQQLALRKELIRRLITSLGQIAQAVGGDDQRLRILAAGLQTTLHSLGGHEPQIDQTLAQLPGLVAQLERSSSAVQGLSAQLDPTLRSLQTGLGQPAGRAARRAWHRRQAGQRDRLGPTFPARARACGAGPAPVQCRTRHRAARVARGHPATRPGHHAGHHVRRRTLCLAPAGHAARSLPYRPRLHSPGDPHILGPAGAPQSY
jgi:virulence factor Mce-like protein